MSKWFYICLALCLCLAMAASPAPSLTLQINKVDMNAFPLISIQFSAWDANGIPLSGLSAQNLFIREDQNIEIHPASLEEISNTSLSVMLVIDVSGSMEGKPLTDAINAANRFLEKLDDKDRVAVIAFANGVNTDPSVLNPIREIGFTNNFSSVFNLIEGLKASGGTEVYNAMEKAVKMTALLPEGHRAILLLTDGRNDPASVGDAEKAITLSRQAGIPVFVIGLGSEVDEAYGQRLAGNTGGLYRKTPRSSELSMLFNDMATLLKKSYALTYASAWETDGKRHELNLRLESPQGSSSAGAYSINLPLKQTSAQPNTTPTAITIQTQMIITPEPTWFEKNQSAVLVALISLAVFIVLVILSRRKVPALVEKCTNCGNILTAEGPCPVCGSTGRIKSRR